MPEFYDCDCNIFTGIASSSVLRNDAIISRTHSSTQPVQDVKKKIKQLQSRQVYFHRYLNTF